MTTWELNGRTWGYSQADVPGQPYFLMGNQLFKTWHLLMQDLAAECAGVSSDSGLAEAARVAAVAAQELAEAARGEAVDSATDAGGSATAAAGSASEAETARAAAVAAKNLAEAARDAAAASAADAGGSATAAGGSATAANESAVAAAASKLAAAASAAAAALDRTAAQTAATNASNSASAAAADRVTVAADKASVATALATAQALVGSAGTGTATGLVYGALTKSLAAAADVVAVYLYDTRLDSDGGAWTDRPGASWYWETLGTATRGATRRFPKVAGIVVRAASITIYDAHDLDAGGVPKMWMVIPSTNLYSGTGLRACFALNGRVYIAGQIGLLVYDFVSDTIGRWLTTTYQFTASKVGTRTTGITRNVGSVGIVSSDSNAVHARVLPGAPLDSAGLPIPTVAVATAGGVSAIHPWGAVYDLTGVACSFVSIGPDDHIYVSGGGVLYREPLPYADRALSASRCYRPNPGTGYVPKIPGGGSDPALPVHLRDGTMVTAARGTVQLPSGLGVGWVAQNAASPDEGMVAYATISYATGWQPGDIRGAWLCDTTTGSITGSAELVTNGDFSGGTTGWTANSSTTAVVSGEIEITSTGLVGPGAYQDIPTVIGQTYLVRCIARRGTSTIDVALAAASAGQPNVAVTYSGTTNAPLMLQFTATATNSRILLYAAGTPAAGQTVYFDNVSIRIALPDRSYKGRGLVPYGTLQRTALPCGLAAVSGYSAASYLEQPYNPDLDYGTGDWSFKIWIDGLSASATIFERAAYAGAYSGPGIRLIADGSGAVFLSVSDDGWASADTVSGTTISGWSQVIACRRGSNYELWQNGVRVGVTPVNNANGSLSNASATLRLGLRLSGAGALLHSMVMAAPAAYAPAPAQIDIMYRDERALIVGGAAATLGGTSNNVTWLAANDSNGTLDVYTSDGLSIFDRLCRVEYRDGGNSGPAIASDTMVAGAASGPYRLVATAANVGFIADAEIARDRMGVPPARAEDTGPWVVTRNSTATRLSCPVQIREGESVTISSIISGRHAALSATQVASYRVEATVKWDYGGAPAVVGSATTTIIQETASGLDATIVVDTANGLIFEQVWGDSALPVTWTAERRIARNTMGGRYAA